MSFKFPDAASEFVYYRCVHVDTPVLCADMKWRPAGSLFEGDDIIVFDEMPDKRSKRKIKIGKVTHNHVENRKCKKIILEDGRNLYCTPEHQWLVRLMPTQTSLEWIKTENLCNRSRGTVSYLPLFEDPWDEDNSYEAGYLSAAFDGEGCIDGISAICFNQTENAMFYKVKKILQNKGFRFSLKIKNKNKHKKSFESKKDCYVFSIYGREQIMKLIGMFGTCRILENFHKNLNKDTFMLKAKKWLKVVSVEDAGEMPVAVMSTTHKTHITGGFPSHNTYSRWRDDLGRRETWEETVDRYIGFFRNKFGDKVPEKVFKKAKEKILNFEVMPSMRALWASGDALEINNCCGYNCSFLFIDSIESFAELLFLLCSGCGVGFSVESSHVDKLPMIPVLTGQNGGVFQVPDSKEGWADSVKNLINSLYCGNDLTIDYSLIRPMGSRLKTMGGRCLTGDTVVYKDRKKSAGFNKITIQQLFDIKQRELSGKYRGKLKKIKLRSLNEESGEFFRNNLVDVVYNGIHPVYQLVTKQGYRIKSTLNHRFMNSAGNYQSLSYFNIGDLIAVNGSKELKTGICCDCKKQIYRRSLRCIDCSYLSQRKFDCLPSTVRQRREIKIYKRKHNNCENCGLLFKLECHHIDGNPYNNEEYNLKVLCPSCHRTEDMKRVYFGNDYTCKYLMYDEIVDIIAVGEEKVYDLVMQGPNHNFIANGIISHNSSGSAPLIQLHEFIRSVFSQRQGSKLKPIDCLDICNKIGACIVAGGTRRSAEISFSDLSDIEIAKAKIAPFPVHRFLSNNSAIYYEKPTITEFLKEWTNLIESKSGERGIFNIEGARNKSPQRRNKELIVGENPCFTGETLVYVADGRGNIPIKQLVKEGKDVPVFCLNNKNVPVVRWMRGPRITGYNVPVYKVLLDDGSSVKVTNNHKFLLKSGEYKETKDLKNGDSLFLLTRYEASMQEIFNGTNSRSQDYFWINYGRAKSLSEYRPIAEFFYNTNLKTGQIVHHKDYNARNNDYKNLEIMTKQQHDKFHAKDMIGDKNPMRRAKYEWSKDKRDKYLDLLSKNFTAENNPRYSGFTDDQIREHAILLTKNLGRRFSNKEWIKYAKRYGLPMNFSKWRCSHLGDIRDLSMWAANNILVSEIIPKNHINIDTRTLRRYKKFLDIGYNCEIINKDVWFHKNCEYCNKKFITRQHYTGFCSGSCGNRARDKASYDQAKASAKVTFDDRRHKNKEKQSSIFIELKNKLGRVPEKKEWMKECKDQGISFEISRNSSPFRYWNDLKEYASNINHKVVSVELCGYEDVYNGTVDEFHNFFIGGFESKTQSGKRKWWYLNNLQCGEILLRDKQFCNLTSVVVKKGDDIDDLLEKVETATWLGVLQSCLTNFPYLRKQWAKNCKEERLLGVSLNGQMDNPEILTEQTLDSLKRKAIKIAEKASKIMNINMPVSITCVKPEGTTSQLVDCASGLHARYSEYYIRTYRIASTDPLFKMLKDQGLKMVPDIGQREKDWHDAQNGDMNKCSIYEKGKRWTEDKVQTWVISFPIMSPKKSTKRNDLSEIQQLEWAKKLQLKWCEHSASATIYVKPENWLEVGSWVYNNWDYVNGLSFLPWDGGVYELAPYEEIDKDTYEKMLKAMPSIDYSQLSKYEKEDNTTGSRELACSGGSCEIK